MKKKMKATIATLIICLFAMNITAFASDAGNDVTLTGNGNQTRAGAGCGNWEVSQTGTARCSGRPCGPTGLFMKERQDKIRKRCLNTNNSVYWVYDYRTVNLGCVCR